MVKLRSYQEEAISGLLTRFGGGCRRVLLQLPTGAGKTVVAAELIRLFLANGKRAMFIAPRRELIDQPCGKLDALGIEYGVYMADDKRRDTWAPVQVASIDTLRARKARLGEIPLMPPHLVIVDECHLYVTQKRIDVLDLWPDAYRLGLTATPARKDGRGLRLLFDDLIEGASVTSLMSEGYLCSARYFSISEPDLSRVRIVAKDYNLADLREVMAPLVGDVVVQTWLGRAGGRRTVVFCVDIAHSAWLCEEFQRFGVAAEHVSAKTPTAERVDIFDRFRSGETQVLSNCQLASYGFDLPDLGCIQLARPTKSLVLYLQMIGRGLRPAEGKTDCIVLDHSGAVLRHGLVEQERAWSLDGHDDLASQARPSGDNGLPVMIKCPECTCVFTERLQCPSCGWVPPPKKKPVHAVDGELIELRPLAREDIDGRKRFYQEILGYAKARPKPWKQGAAAHKYKERYGEFPPWSWNSLPAVDPSAATRNWLLSRFIAYKRGGCRA